MDRSGANHQDDRLIGVRQLPLTFDLARIADVRLSRSRAQALYPLIPRLSMYSETVGTNLIRGHLEGLLLAALVEEPGHGYALSQRLAARSGGELAVPEGSLYPALQRLERLGFVTSSWARAEGRRRRIYRLSGAGRRQAETAAREWKVFSAGVDRVLGGLP